MKNISTFSVLFLLLVWMSSCGGSGGGGSAGAPSGTNTAGTPNTESKVRNTYVVTPNGIKVTLNRPIGVVESVSIENQSGYDRYIRITPDTSLLGDMSFDSSSDCLAGAVQSGGEYKLTMASGDSCSVSILRNSSVSNSPDTASLSFTIANQSILFSSDFCAIDLFPTFGKLPYSALESTVTIPDKQTPMSMEDAQLWRTPTSSCLSLK